MALFDVVTIGSAVQDVFLRSKSFEETPDEHAPDGVSTCLALGAKIGLDDIIFTTGGGATNAAVTFARFGLKTACLSRVGKDSIGQAIKDELKAAGIESKYLQIDSQAKTGYSVILLSGAGHRTILTYRGAALNFHSQELPWAKAWSKGQAKPFAKWMYLTSLGGNDRLLVDLFDYAEATGTKVAWNPGNGELALGLEHLESVIRKTDILILNREEAAQLAQMTPRHMDKIIAKLSLLPKQALVVTDGKNGAYIQAEHMTYFAPPIPAHRINTTGAGDAFGSAFTGAIIKGKKIKEALQVGMLNATGVITHMGAKAGILRSFPKDTAIQQVQAKIIALLQSRGPFRPVS